MNPEILDELSKKLASALPEGVATLQDDLEKNIRSALGGIMQKMNLVSREEFDVQQKVLARTREKLESLEKQLAALEKTVK